MSFSVILAITLSNVIYGLSVFFTGNLTGTTDVLDILALRYLVTLAVLFLLKKLRALKITVGVRDIFKRSDRRSSHIKTLLLAGLFEPVIYMFLETVGISMTTGITAGVILALSPIFSCICESVILKEKNSLISKLFLGIGILGVIYIAVNTETSDGKDSVAGILFMFGAVASGQIFVVLSRKASYNFSSLDRSYIMAVLGAAAFNAVNIVRHLIKGDILHYFDPLTATENIVPFIYLGIISSVVATTFANFAYARAQASSLAAFSGVSTLVTVAAGVILNGERLYYYHIIGMALIFIRIIGVSLIDMKKSRGGETEKSN